GLVECSVRGSEPPTGRGPGTGSTLSASPPPDGVSPGRRPGPDGAPLPDVSSREVLLVEPLEEARLARVPLPELADPARGLAAPAGPIGEVAEVRQQADRPVVVLGALRGDQLLDLAPRGRLAPGQLLQLSGPGLGLLALAAGPLPG